MPLRVNTNLPSINVRRILNNNNRDLATRIERLSSGLRINRAADDAAGLSVSEGMRAELGGLSQAVRNAEQATNLIQTAEGALNEVNAILIRMRELAVQSSSSTINNSNRESLNAEYVQLINEIDRIGTVTSDNNLVLRGAGPVVKDDDEADAQRRYKMIVKGPTGAHGRPGPTGTIVHMGPYGPYGDHMAE